MPSESDLLFNGTLGELAAQCGNANDVAYEPDTGPSE
jgi:hypothetical protein